MSFSRQESEDGARDGIVLAERESIGAGPGEGGRRAPGGSQPFGPGVLLQQWRMSGLEDQARSEGLLD